jgi:hypothetical protein
MCTQGNSRRLDHDVADVDGFRHHARLCFFFSFPEHQMAESVRTLEMDDRFNGSSTVDRWSSDFPSPRESTLVYG